MVMADHTLFKNYVTTSANVYARYDSPKQAPKPLQTTGSVVVLSEVAAGDDPFVGTSVGDLIHFRLQGMHGATTTRRVAGVASVPDAVSVNAAISLGTAGVHYHYQKWHATTSADNDEGWFFCGDAEDKSVLIAVTTLNSTNVTYVINGDIGGQTFQLDTGTITSATQVHVPIVENVRRLQVGLKQVGAGANDVSVFYRAKPKEARP